MKQYGTVLVFKPGTDRTEIDWALQRLAHLLDDGQFIDDKGQPVPYRVQSFDPSHGSGPVWYIP